jgi:hypothetical protein
MKFKTSLPILIFIFTLFSCKKENSSVDQREAFIGTYQGTINTKIPALNLNETDQYAFDISKGASNTNQIKIDGTINATVNGNSYTYTEFTITDNVPNVGAIVYILNGTGTLNGTNLIETGTLKAVIQGTSYSGTWSTNMVKQ